MISKWFEVLQGINHNEPLRVVTRKAEPFLTSLSTPGLFLTFNIVTWFKGHTLDWGTLPYMETSLFRPNTEHMI